MKNSIQMSIEIDDEAPSEGNLTLAAFEFAYMISMYTNYLVSFNDEKLNREFDEFVETRTNA